MIRVTKSIRRRQKVVVLILVLISFFFFLSLAEWLSSIVFRAGIIGPIIVGIIYGMPLADILLEVWQETFLAIGYIGLIFIIFEGGLTTRMDLLKQNFFLSMLAATTGVVFPIGLSYLLLYLGFGYGAVETFIIGAALSTTSLGTTFAVIGGASKDIDLSQTRIGAVLVSAAVIDDVSGLVMSSVIHDLGSLSAGGGVNLGWLIGRPILASILMAGLTPLLCKYVFAPVFRRFIEHHFARFDHLSNVVLMVLVLSAFISIAAFAGTSVLFGAFLAGSFLTYLPSKHPEGPFVVYSREHGEENDNKSPTFVHTFEKYFSDVQKYLMEPLFFASIGFAIPFIDLWTGSAIWHGVVYTLLMLIAKVIVGIWVPLWDVLTKKKTRDVATSSLSKAVPPAALLGAAMVARGEIGLLIVEIGYNSTPYVSDAGFYTAVWAILLNTIIGPMVVGILIKFRGKEIGTGHWGIQETGGQADGEKAQASSRDQALEEGSNSSGQ
ncbi:CPA2 familytransporter [Aureobasidium pullulans]|uniref:CPA2 familytransporter n=1 Tax=Aureobasidium pullulans TaxID=5580 RepID=A0A4S9V0R1_AURPU|nr:CPA2 familytransporter [Aureobasidium pullulans]